VAEPAHPGSPGGGILWRHNILMALRALRRARGYTWINVAGLAVGMSAALLILLWVKDELSYDRTPVKAERIFRIGARITTAPSETALASSCAPLAPALKTECPLVEDAVRLMRFGQPVVRGGGKAFSEPDFWLVDPEFPKMFSVRFLRGNPDTALAAGGTVVLSRRAAMKYFGDQDPLGQSLTVDGSQAFVVTGVVEEAPRQSHIHYDFLSSLAGQKSDFAGTWLMHPCFTYVLLKPGAVPAALTRALKRLTDAHVWPEYEKTMGQSTRELRAGGRNFRFEAMPLTDIHLRSRYDFEIEPGGDIRFVYLFSIIASAVLLLACINYINLSSARLSTRYKEVAVRKTLGAEEGSLVIQFVTETLATVILAFLLTLLILELFLPTFNLLSGKAISFSELWKPAMIPAHLMLILGVGLLAGAYPAMRLASRHPAQILRVSSMGRGRRPWLRILLVVAQFAASILLFIGTVAVHRQVSFLSRAKMGFNGDDVWVIQKADDLGKKQAQFKRELLKNPNILSASVSTAVMGTPFGVYTFASDAPAPVNRLLWVLAADDDFVSTYRIRIQAGRSIEEAQAQNANPVLINEAAARLFGWTSAPGAVLRSPPHSGEGYRVAGVVQNFHFESLREAVHPLVILHLAPEKIGRYLSIRLSPADRPATLAYMQKIWNRLNPDLPLEVSAFEEVVGRMYLKERLIGRLFLAFSLLTLFIGCLGLLGLASYMTEQRTKEIGIRKALGAGTSEIVGILCLEYVCCIAAATLIAWPIAYVFVERWLATFEAQAPIHPLVYGGSGILVLVLALLAAGYQALRAALANPVESLRYE
jgi:putative ABC transport system permease protein